MAANKAERMEWRLRINATMLSEAFAYKWGCIALKMARQWREFKGLSVHTCFLCTRCTRKIESLQALQILQSL